MSDEQNSPAPGTSAVMVKETPAPTAPAKPAGVSLAAVIPGYKSDGKPWPIFLDPSLGSTEEGRIRADFEPPDAKTLDTFEDMFYGTKNKRKVGKPDRLGAYRWLIRTKLIDVYGVLAEDDAAIKQAYGSWKQALVAEAALRPMLKTLATLYIGKCRVAGDVEDDEDEG